MKINFSVKPFAKVIINNTRVGKTILDAKISASVARNIPLQAPPAPSMTDVIKTVFEGTIKNGHQIISDLAKNDLGEQFGSYAKKVSERFAEFAKASNDPLSVAPDSLGLGPSKFFQIIASDESIMKQLPEHVRQIILKSKSNNTPTRTLKEAQQEIDAAFGNKYSIKDRLGVGSVGEAYLAEAKSGKEFVPKMIKKGLDKESVEIEEQVFSKLVEFLAKDGEDGQRKSEMLKALYEDWKKELDFTQEVANNKALAQGAKRYKVAGIAELSKDAKCVIYEKAQGVKAEKFVNMVLDYRHNPVEYAQKYKSELAEHPWMSNPEEPLKEFATSYIKAFSEMMLFVKKGSKSVMHGDPHVGNVFVTKDSSGKILPTFIDTGCCINRTSGDVAADLNFFTNYFVGNSNGIASYFVSKAKYLPAGKSMQEIKASLAKKLDEKLFRSGGNITDLVKSQKIINNLLDEEKIFINPKDSTALKAQMQFVATGLSLHQLSGNDSGDILVKILPDVAKGIGHISLRENPIPIIKPAAKHILDKGKDAMESFFQFIV